MKQWKRPEWLSAPVTVTWEVTHRCNLSCIHCLSDSGPERHGELPLDQSLAVIEQLAAHNVFQVNFGGGEPLTRKDLPILLEACSRKGLVSCISTNGTLLDERMLSFLEHTEGIYLQVSLDGASAKVNDRIRGKGTFAMVMKAMERLSTRGIPFSINMVLTRLNIAEIPCAYRLARDHGASLRISRFRPSGRGRHSWHMLSLSRSQMEAFSRWLSNHTDVSTGDSFFFLEGEKRQGMGLGICGAARFTCCIDPLGRVYPCAFLQEEHFCQGELTSRSLGDIWSSAPLFKELRNLKVQACRACQSYEKCHGGCPAVAHFLKGELEHRDPECLAQGLGRGG